MAKICILGVTASGKTCFLYAMAEVLGQGIKTENGRVRFKSNDHFQRQKLTLGYEDLINRHWPSGTSGDEVEKYEFSVDLAIDNVNYQTPVFHLFDYRGGILSGAGTDNDRRDLDRLLKTFRGSSSIIFMIDSKTLISALPSDDRSVSHRIGIDTIDVYRARKQVDFIESILMEYAKIEDNFPPVMIVISKSDIFDSNYERTNAISYIKDNLPMLFSSDSKYTSAITTLSLGEGLSKDSDGRLLGKLNMSTDYNIHIPVLFGLYCELDFEYYYKANSYRAEEIEKECAFLRKIIANHIEIYVRGKRAYPVD